MRLSVITLLFLPFIFSGCLSELAQKLPVLNSSDVQVKKEPETKNTTAVYSSVQDLTKEITKQLLANHIKPDKKTIIVTSFVNLNQLNSTSDFGRLVGENMISQLHMEGFRVKEYRGQNAVSINADGEFNLTRDIKKLPNTIEADYILIGTYSNINDTTLSINSRIVDFANGDIYATANAVYSSSVTTVKKNSNNQPVSKKTVDVVRDF
ncbi:MAG: FlgO family outer membrane protein [Campylobacterota bacterium]